MKKKVLFLGASGLVGPFVTPGLEADCDLLLADVKPHPDGTPIQTVDVTSYEAVHEAARGMDAIANFTVVRGDPVLSFHVNTRGAWHVMKAAAAHGIRKVIQTGPQGVSHAYEPEFDIVDAPPAQDSGYYGCTKFLGAQICRIFARTHRIHTAYFVFGGLGPRPTEPVSGDFAPMRIFWEDLQHACRLALKIDAIPDYFQEFTMHSCDGHQKYRLEKARRMLGYEPTQRWETYYRRTP